MAKGGEKLTPADVVAIIDAHVRLDWSNRRIAREFGFSVSTVNHYVRQWKEDPDAIRLFVGWTLDPESARPDGEEHEYLQEVRRLLLEDIEWLHLSTHPGYEIHPSMRQGWALQDLHDEVVLACFRGYGKSEAFSETRIKRQILRSAEAYRLEMLGKHVPSHYKPNIAICLVSDIDKMALRHGRVVLDFLEEERVRMLWGDFKPTQKGQPWTAKELLVRHRSVGRSDPTLTCDSVNSSLWTGLHPDELYLDDVVTEKAITPTRLANLKAVVSSTLLPAVQPDGKKFWVNTPYSREDPISIRLRRGEDGGRGQPVAKLVVPAWTGTGKCRVATWPSRRPLEKLDQLKVEMDEEKRGAFTAQMLMDTSEFEERPLDLSDVPHVHIDDVPEALILFQNMDAAWKKKPDRRSDHHAMATGGFHDGTFYLFRVMRAKKAIAEARALMRLEHHCWADMWGSKPRIVWTEKTVLHLDELRGLFKDLGRTDPETGLGRLPLKPYTPRGTKEVRAVAIEHLVATGRFVMVDGTGPWQKEFEKEVEDFPASTWDDQVDAVAGLIGRLMKRGSGGARAAKEPRKKDAPTPQIVERKRRSRPQVKRPSPRVGRIVRRRRSG